METTNNVILITGGTSGIGLEMVKTFYGLNNKIIVAARDKDKLDELKNQLPHLHICKADLTKQTDIDGLVLYIEQQHKDLNILINNAGIQYNYHFLSEQNIVNRIDYEISANLTATIKLCALLLPTLVKQKRSAIVNISSGLALHPKKSAPVYCATKAGVHNFTKALRYQLENTSVKVFEIIPSLIDTPMTQGRGSNKITPRQLINEFLRNFKADKYESYIGKTKLLRLIGRFAPSVADRILKNG